MEGMHRRTAFPDLNLYWLFSGYMC